jgi:hypothetical protein
LSAGRLCNAALALPYALTHLNPGEPSTNVLMDWRNSLSSSTIETEIIFINSFQLPFWSSTNRMILPRRQRKFNPAMSARVGPTLACRDGSKEWKST